MRKSTLIPFLVVVVILAIGASALLMNASQGAAPAATGMSTEEAAAQIAASVELTIVANGLVPNATATGLPLPADPATATPEPPSAERVLASTPTAVIPAAGGSRQHIVQAGDSLGAIASQYSVTVEGIMSLNGIVDPDLIYIGQSLRIPESVSTFSGYSGADDFALTGAQFQVFSTILGQVGYAKQADELDLPWPGTWEEVARPKFEHINGQPVWRSQAVLPGETALYVGSGFNSPVGHFVGCSAGWFRNGTDQTITVWVLSMSEIVVGNSDNYDGMARELALRTSSGNQCQTAYLGQIPLH